MHPGWADTEGVRTSIPGFHSAFQAKLRDAAQGADTIVWLALEEASKLQPGAFYLDRQPQTKHLTLGGTKYSKEQPAELYAKLLDMAGLSQVSSAAAASGGPAPAAAFAATDAAQPAATEGSKD
jgi:dehydrogenase/reductase SDR family protein 12